MGGVGVIGFLVADNRLPAKGVDEGSPTCRRGEKGFVSNPVRCIERAGSRGKLKLWTRLNLPVPDAPQTIKQNWIPFFTFFLRRIIFYRLNTHESAMESKYNNGCSANRWVVGAGGDIVVVVLLLLFAR